MTSSLSKSLGWLEHNHRWEKILAASVLALGAFLLFYNPRSQSAPLAG